MPVYERLVFHRLTWIWASTKFLESNTTNEIRHGRVEGHEVTYESLIANGTNLEGANLFQLCK